MEFKEFKNETGKILKEYWITPAEWNALDKTTVQEGNIYHIVGTIDEEDLSASLISKIESKINATKLYKHEISAYNPDEPYALSLTLLNHKSTAYSTVSELISPNLEDWGLILYAYFNGKYSLGNINATYINSEHVVIISAYFLEHTLSSAGDGTFTIYSGLTNFSDVVTDI